MVHVPKILKKSAKVIKTSARAAAVSGVAIVQAHPVAAALTVVAIVSVGIAIYYCKNSSRCRKNKLNYSSGATTSHDGNANDYFYDPETKSITSEVPLSNNLDKEKALRKTTEESHDAKKFDKGFIHSSSASNILDCNEKPIGESQSVQLSDENCINLPVTSHFRQSNKANDCKTPSSVNSNENHVNLPLTSISSEKTSKLAVSRSVQKLDENCFNLQAVSNTNDEAAEACNLVEKSDDNVINLTSSSKSLECNEKLVNESHSVHLLDENCVNLAAVSNFPQSKKTGACENHSVENHDENYINLPLASISSESNNKTAGEFISVHKLNKNCITTPTCSNLSGNSKEPTGETPSDEHLNESVINLPSNSYRYWTNISFGDSTYFGCKTSNTLLSDKFDWCKTCGENPVNTHMKPCNHRYMCADCAKKIFKCRVCLAKIEDIIVEKQ